MFIGLYTYIEHEADEKHTLVNSKIRQTYCEVRGMNDIPYILANLNICPHLYLTLYHPRSEFQSAMSVYQPQGKYVSV